jgi:hypothetical protein
MPKIKDLSKISRLKYLQYAGSMSGGYVSEIWARVSQKLAT